MRSPTCLNVSDHLTLDPGQVGVNGQNKENQNRDLDDRNDQKGVFGQEVGHDFASASGKDCIIVQKRPSVPLVNRLSFAGRIRPTGTSYGAWPFFEKWGS